MDEQKDTVAMNELLEEITSRIDSLRAKKHARAFDIALWWEMERQMIAAKNDFTSLPSAEDVQRKN